MARRGTTARMNLAELEKLCAMQCTDEEIAAWFGVSVRTIERRRKQRKFREAMERGRAKGRISVRRLQMKLLEEGNATMGVWLGKQVLGQKEQASHALEGAGFSQVNVVMPTVTLGSLTPPWPVSTAVSPSSTLRQLWRIRLDGTVEESDCCLSKSVRTAPPGNRIGGRPSTMSASADDGLPDQTNAIEAPRL